MKRNIAYKCRIKLKKHPQPSSDTYNHIHDLNRLRISLYVGRFIVKSCGKPSEIISKLNERAGCGPNKEIELYVVSAISSLEKRKNKIKFVRSVGEAVDAHLHYSSRTNAEDVHFTFVPDDDTSENEC